MFQQLEKNIRSIRYQLQRNLYAYFPAIIKHRREIPYLLNQRSLLGIGVEIGVKEGKFSEEILKKWKRETTRID